MIRLLTILGTFAFVSSACGQALDPLLSADGLWTRKPDELMASAGKLGFVWTSNAHDSARAARKGLSVFGLPAVESIMRFKNEKLTEITVMLYARGDVGDLSKEKFETLVRNSAETLDKETKMKGSPRGKDPKNAVKAEGLLWQTNKAHYLLEYSFTKEMKSRGVDFRAEFVRLEITPPTTNANPFPIARISGPGKFAGASHVKKDPAGGDVWIGDVPMVDQGQKGYCVVATTERVMRYYGGSVDQQELAQVANTSTDGGTSSDAMVAALRKLSTRLKIRVREVEKSDVKQILSLISDYNRAAKRADSAAIPDQGNMIDVGEVYRAMDVEILRQVRTKNKSDLNRFQRAVQSHIDQGVPLLWTVMLGKVPEAHAPQSGGGHMRLIIGYNTKKEEILFSDSWGAGHELKRMPAVDAWTITTGALSIEPF